MNSKRASQHVRLRQGSAGVPPAVSRVSRDTSGVDRRHSRNHALRHPMSDAGRAGRQAGRPRHPKTILSASPRKLTCLSSAVLLKLAALFFAVQLFAACQRNDSASAITVKSWRTWMLPTDGAVQPTPRSLTTGPRDELAVMDTAGRILIYDKHGALLRQWKMLDVQFGKPEGIVWLKDDRIVVCDTHYRRLVWFDQEGRVLKTVGQHGKGRGEFIYPVGICKDAAENLYVCEYGGNDRVQVFTRDGEWLREFGTPGTGPAQFQRPSGLVWHDGKIFVADSINNRVLIFTDAGKYLGLLGAGTDGKSTLTFNLPYDITFAPDGNLYVIEYGAGRLSRISLEGRLLGRYGQAGRGDGEFATPWGVAVDSRMRVLVADTMNRRIVALQL